MKKRGSMPSLVETARVLALLAITSFLYDMLVVTPAEEHIPPRKTITAFEVVIGVFYTLVGYLMLTVGRTIEGGQSFILLLSCFAASGVPMIFGSLRRASNYTPNRR